MFYNEFSNEFKLVDKECLLISNGFASGLTNLRKANIENKGLFYTSFFQLSMAIERICKLALGINNYSLTGEFLTLKEMKNLGHDIDKLLRMVQSKIPCEITQINDNVVSKEVVKLLNNFARSTRYYNLDLLAGGVDLGNDPLDCWINEVIPLAYRFIIESNPRLNSSIKRKIERHGEMYKSIENLSNIFYISIDGGTLENNAKEFKMIYEVTPYLIIEIANIIKPIIEYMDSIIKNNYKGGLELPYVREYFYHNILLEDQFLLTRKKYRVLITD